LLYLIYHFDVYYKVCPYTRVKLVIDLVHSIYNIKMEKITEKACEHRKDVDEQKDSIVKWWMNLKKGGIYLSIVLHNFGLIRHFNMYKFI